MNCYLIYGTAGVLCLTPVKKDYEKYKRLYPAAKPKLLELSLSDIEFLIETLPDYHPVTHALENAKVCS